MRDQQGWATLPNSHNWTVIPHFFYKETFGYNFIIAFQSRLQIKNNLFIAGIL